MTTAEYIESISKRYKLGNSTEHTFRGDLQQLLESLLPSVAATNEPKRQSCGAPDYILTKKEIPIGFIEAKDIGDTDLDGKKKSGNKEQFDRYKGSLTNLIFTDYLNFHLYQEGEFITKIAIAKLSENGIIPLTENYAPFENLVTDFGTHVGQTIKSSKRLAEMMAGKARLLSDVLEKALTSDEDHDEDSTLKQQMAAFKNILIHDITPKGFADVYAQTIAYGLFAARLHDPTLDTFSRQEAAELIPKSNPFLRRLFGYIAGPNIDDRIKWIVDNLVEIFLACNVVQILKNYGRSTKMEDPIIHFYETFLAEYDPKLRKARGVWYTPAPVVNFIVRAVDDILKTDFGLSQGLADTSKTKIKVDTQTPDKRSATGFKQVEQEVHKVQILDPATGTGTFLAEVIKQVHQKFIGQEGIWGSYVENHLLPRLNGFEILMASYAMAHLKLDLLLSETGFKPTKTQRTRVYLTNSLEEYHPDTGTLFAGWLSAEANEANHIKRDSPVMCVIGNPPYAVSSTNKNDWIDSLIADYKKDLNEKSYNSLSDDYVKFIRYGQHYIEKNGSGVLAYISNNSFIDGTVFRQMRKHILGCFDTIHIIDLHGSTKKNEISPDGSKDQNVFDIMQGVSINIFVKTGRKKKGKLGVLKHFEIYGKRDSKYDFLNKNILNSIRWNTPSFKEPNYFFTNKNYEGQEQYNSGFVVNQLFKSYNTGIETGRDKFFVDFNSRSLSKKVENVFENLHSPEIIESYKIKDGSGFKFKSSLSNSNFDSKLVKKILYRPFDSRFSYYDPSLQRRPGFETMFHAMDKDNYGFLTCRRQTTFDFQHCFVTNSMSERCSISLQTGELAYHFPLYLYSKSNGQQTIGQTEERIPNLKVEIVMRITENLGLSFTNEKESNVKTFAPIDILDYIYGVLHSPTYRKKYKEFLKIDFPRIPYPKNQDSFWQLVKLGGELRQIHLLESSNVEAYITSYPKGGSNMVTTKIGKADWKLFNTENGVGRIWINEEQYFDKIPLTAWEFYIGGYQPAQKWLKDRRGRTLEMEDIFHYQKIIVALMETDRLMKEIDKIDIEQPIHGKPKSLENLAI